MIVCNFPTSNSSSSGERVRQPYRKQQIVGNRGCNRASSTKVARKFDLRPPLAATAVHPLAPRLPAMLERVRLPPHSQNPCGRLRADSGGVGARTLVEQSH